MKLFIPTLTALFAMLLAKSTVASDYKKRIPINGKQRQRGMMELKWVSSPSSKKGDLEVLGRESPSCEVQYVADRKSCDLASDEDAYKYTILAEDYNMVQTNLKHTMTKSLHLDKPKISL